MLIKGKGKEGKLKKDSSKGKEEWPALYINFLDFTSASCGHPVDSIVTRDVVREESSRYDINSHVKLFRK